jgi:hypothetical protein
MIGMANIIFQGYSQSEEFLALKLLKVFVPIENEQDRALHNDMIKDITAMVGKEKMGLCKKIAGIIVHRDYQVRKSFVRKIARTIIELGAQKDAGNTRTT